MDDFLLGWKMEVLKVIRLFWELVFPYISYTQFIQVRIPPF